MLLMRPVRSSLRTLGIAVLGSALLFSSAFAQTVDKDPKVKQAVMEKLKTTIDRFAFVPNTDFKKLNDFLDANKEKIEGAKDDEEFVRGINDALRKFGFSHIVLNTPKSTERRNTGKTVGIGFQSSVTPEGLLIIRVVEGAPASEVKLEPGDLITEVDGQKADGPGKIAGEEGTKVRLKVKKRSGKVETYELTRRPFSTIRKEELTWVDKNTAKISVWSFDMRNYDSKNVAELIDKAKDAKNLIIDLRFNGGGAVVNLMHLAGFFISSEDTMGYMIDRGTYTRFEKENGRKPNSLIEASSMGRAMKPRSSTGPVYKGNVVVLVNEGSGSAAEIFAAAMKEIYGASVVGSKSAGAVLVSVIVDATNGFSMQYPISDYVTLRGTRLEGNGVVPDVEVKVDRPALPFESDPVIEKSLAVLERIRLREERTGGKSGS